MSPDANQGRRRRAPRAQARGPKPNPKPSQPNPRLTVLLLLDVTGRYFGKIYLVNALIWGNDVQLVGTRQETESGGVGQVTIAHEIASLCHSCKFVRSSCVA